MAVAAVAPIHKKKDHPKDKFYGTGKVCKTCGRSRYEHASKNPYSGEWECNLVLVGLPKKNSGHQNVRWVHVDRTKKGGSLYNSRTKTKLIDGLEIIGRTGVSEDAA